jgi:hypothetical protein
MAKSKQSVYGVHPSVYMVQKSIAQLPEKTGKSLDEWISFIKKHGPKTQDARQEWLKSEHKLGTNYAWWLAQRAEGIGWEDGDPDTYLATAPKFVDDMFSGPKIALRPIYDKLLETCLAIAPDVKACPCSTMVPIFRNHVIAQIKPTTRTRIDLGLALKDMKGSGRLIETGGYAKKDRITHRIGITALTDIDKDVKSYLKRAYDMDKD